MKKTLLLLLLTSFLFSCEKSNEKIDNLKFINIIPGECAIGITGRENTDYVADTVFYTITEDSLSIFVGFNSECALRYKTGTKISNDTIFINIDRIEGPVASCICYYTYEFNYTRITSPYHYIIYRNGYNWFSGYIKP